MTVIRACGNTSPCPLSAAEISLRSRQVAQYSPFASVSLARLDDVELMYVLRRLNRRLLHMSAVPEYDVQMYAVDTFLFCKATCNGLPLITDIWS